MKLFDEVIAGVGRKSLRRHRVQAEIENVDLPGSEAEAAHHHLSSVENQMNAISGPAIGECGHAYGTMGFAGTHTNCTQVLRERLPATGSFA
jgi:hypothetical protein